MNRRYGDPERGKSRNKPGNRMSRRGVGVIASVSGCAAPRAGKALPKGYAAAHTGGKFTGILGRHKGDLEGDVVRHSEPKDVLTVNAAGVDGPTRCARSHPPDAESMRSRSKMDLGEPVGVLHPSGGGVTCPHLRQYHAGLAPSPWGRPPHIPMTPPTEHAHSGGFPWGGRGSARKSADGAPEIAADVPARTLPERDVLTGPRASAQHLLRRAGGADHSHPDRARSSRHADRGNRLDMDATLAGKTVAGKRPAVRIRYSHQMLGRAPNAGFLQGPGLRTGHCAAGSSSGRRLPRPHRQVQGQ